MRKVILIGGDLASGKSTYSRFLSKKLGLTLLNKDVLKEILGDHFYAANREENKVLSVVAFELIKYFITSSTCDIIIESNFKEYEMQELKEMLKTDQVLSLKFSGDDKMLHQRFLKRLNNGRHYVHKSQDFTEIKPFIETLNELRRVKYIGRVIEVFADNNDLSQNEKLLMEIENFLRRDDNGV